jgi:hypothetical protein
MKSLNLTSKYVFSSPSNREKLQNILNRTAVDSNELDSITWYLNGVVLDFNILTQLHRRYPDWWKNKSIDLISLAKLLVLESIDGKRSAEKIKEVFDALIKTLFYLAENNTHSIKKKQLDQHIGFLMMTNIEEKGLVRRLTPLAFKKVQKYLVICFRELPRILNIHGLKDLLLNSGFSEKVITSAAKSAIAIESGGDLTYRDWQEGGSFNHLTLDFGRYYIDHCTSFFNQNLGIALALKKTIEKIPIIIEMAGLSTSEGNVAYITTFVNSYLIGCDSGTFMKKPCYVEICHAASRDFSYNLRQIRAFETLRTGIEIDNLAKLGGIEELDEDKREWIKHLIDIRESVLIPEFTPPFSAKGDSEYNCLNSVIGSSVDLNALNCAIDCAYQRLLQSVSAEPPPLSFYESIDYAPDVKLSKSSKGILLRFLDNVEHAGIVRFVSLSGWRESEYGFSLSDIEISANRDILDQFANPVRYAVHWKVPKTNGATKLHRDITRSAYRCAYQLTRLVSAKAEDPCLYTFNTCNKIPKESGHSIRLAIPAMWSHFVGCYDPFIQLDLLEELDVLRGKLSHNNVEANRFAELSQRAIREKWDNLKSDLLLVEAHRRAREEHDRVAFFLNRDKKPMNWVWEYRNSNLQPVLQNLLDTYLSEETRAVIEALETEQDVTRTLTRAITNELIGDCLYPTPHALRHMWAEAVYRRFDGDAGWMIRSQFKHISQSMWLAYIRNKDNRRQHEQVKRRVVSSLLANYLRKNGKGYAGAMDRLLKRLFIMTTSSTIEQLHTAIDQYGILEIADIKANPWGYCLLRRRNQAHAKCAEGGVPQRHNASPAFCLGCTNNLTQETNIPGIILGISNDLKVLNTPQVPESFRRVAYNTVANAVKQLRKLDADHNTLNEIETALKTGSEKRRLS